MSNAPIEQLDEIEGIEHISHLNVIEATDNVEIFSFVSRNVSDFLIRELRRNGFDFIDAVRYNRDVMVYVGYADC